MPPVNALLRLFFDALIPRVCAGCNTKLELTEKTVCGRCLSGAEYAGDDYILQQYNINFSGSAVDSFTTLFIFRAESIVQKISHSFKYSGMFRNAVYAGELLGDKLLSKEITSETDFIIPVPLHPLKKHERGYNQTDYICRGISRVTGLELHTNVVRRIKNTRTQAKLNRSERVENVRNAFIVKKPFMVEGKTILLVDDVKTTGSTLAEAAKVLKDAGCKKIIAATFAIAAGDTI